MDPATITTLAVPVLQEAIKSLVGLAGDALRRWRERQAARPPAEAGDAAPPPERVAATIEMPDIVEGELEPIQYDMARVERLEEELRYLRHRLTDYAEGIEQVDASDAELAAAAEALRRVLEAVIGQRITFKGEDRGASGPIVEGDVDVEEVRGDVAAVRARLIAAGTVKGVARARVVDRGGKLSGVDVDEVRGG